MGSLIMSSNSLREVVAYCLPMIGRTSFAFLTAAEYVKPFSVSLR